MSAQGLYGMPAVVTKHSLWLASGTYGHLLVDTFTLNYYLDKEKFKIFNFIKTSIINTLK